MLQPELRNAKDPKMNEEQDNILSKTIARAQRLLGQSLISVVLFGSRARGTATPGSDFDLLIIAQSLPDRKRRRDLDYSDDADEAIADAEFVIEAIVTFLKQTYQLKL